MIISVLFTGHDQKSYFSIEKIETPILKPLGNYSIPMTSESVQFREFSAGLVYPMHNPPRAQYIIYLEGSVEVRASGGETKRFSAGDILLVKDKKGKVMKALLLKLEGR